MTTENERWLGDLKVAAGFVRAIRTGHADLDLELQELADRISDIAANQTAKRVPLTGGQNGRNAA